MVEIVEGEQPESIKKQVEEAIKLKKLNEEIENQFKRALYFKCGNDLYVWIDIDGHKEIMKVFGGKINTTFENYFKHRMMEIGTDNDEIKDKLERIIGQSMVKSKKYRLCTRVCSEGGNTNTIWYDLTNDNWECIKTVPTTLDSPDLGWSLERVTPCPMFYRWEHQIPQVYPEKIELEEAKEIIWKLFFDDSTGKGILRMKDKENMILRIVSLIAKFIPEIERVIDLTVAPAGYAKSYSDKITKLTVDPSDIIAFGRPSRYNQEVVQNIFHHWLYCIDNCNDNLSAGISDLFSRVVTGAYDSQRQLYSNDKDFVRDLSYHPITINSTINPITRADLIERTVLFELNTTIEEKRETPELDAEYNELKPKLLGSIFTILSKSMWLRNNMTPISIKHRMVNFIKWGYCISEVIGIGGNKFMDIYTKRTEIASFDIVNENSIAKLLKFLVDVNKEYIGNMTGLWTILYSENKDVKQKSDSLPLGNERDMIAFSDIDKSISQQYINKTGDYSILNDKPKSTDSLGKRIASIENDLKKSGILITRDVVWIGNKAERIIKVAKVEK